MACLIAGMEFNIGPRGVRGVEENDQQLRAANNYSVCLESSSLIIFTYAELISLYGKGNGITTHWRKRKEERE